jgi:phosphoribosylamine--glycine ligase
VRVLVVGGGGREHALCWAFHREDPTLSLFCAPGNPGTSELATNLPIPTENLDGLVEAVEQHGIDLTVVGPEVPLAEGLADRLRGQGRPVFGPDAAAARIESSKAFAKDLMVKAGVPTAASRSFTDLPSALGYIAKHPEPLVVKASGLAAGKGAVVCATRDEARSAADAMLGDRRFGEAGLTIVIEEFMTGEELSVLALTDGRELTILPAAQDHKRLEDGDRGPNTGGMGAFSPVSLATPALLQRARREVFEPTLAALERAGARYRGVLYAGLMVDGSGAPRVVEFNCRFGDPETQVIVPLLGQGFVASLSAVARGGSPTPLSIRPDTFAVTTVLASRGYPDRPARGAEIRIPSQVPDGVMIFHAGTTRDEQGRLRVAAGRVLNVTAVAGSFTQAQALSRETAGRIDFEGKVYRHDIGWREAARLSARH